MQSFFESQRAQVLCSFVCRTQASKKCNNLKFKVKLSNSTILIKSSGACTLWETQYVLIFSKHVNILIEDSHKQVTDIFNLTKEEYTNTMTYVHLKYKNLKFKLKNLHNLHKFGIPPSYEKKNCFKILDCNQSVNSDFRLFAHKRKAQKVSLFTQPKIHLLFLMK